MRGTSPPSSRVTGPCSGEGGARLRSKGTLVPAGGDDVGLLALEAGVEVDRSSAPVLAPTGELSDSLRAWTGDAARGGMGRGGGDDNFRHRWGDLSFSSSPLLPL